ncbi:phosphate ABC transporter permease PstA [Dictyobacter arantiisoli]|uniref:Phosphate transport system permease protein PstA n=1 Tax=Dictyobacter arantiisoli TaxID=2014874 RepID=A0A5A5TDI4_9CHLR|nr:phosphate ABC transporter permease PstA [Dictyobacter arantiisoli]GCF09275.1 phosphate transport system permease protein PstA [Dictyobacter arantiisoli]
MSAQQQISTSVESDERQRLLSLERLTQRLHLKNNIASGILALITLLGALLFILIVIKVLWDGIPYLINPDFYGSTGTGTVGQQIFNTLYLLILSEIILVPIALAAAIYLVEYARQGPLVTVIHFAAETLAGVPSLVLGLFGYLVFATVLHLGLTRLTGTLTLLCLNFPVALRLFEDALTSVAREQREGGLALGSTKWHMIRTVVLPSSLPGIITGIVLSAGKVIAEAAALIFTMGSSNPSNVYTLNPMISTDNLTIHIWYLKTVGAGTIPDNVANAVSAGSAALLIIILLVINIGSRSIGRLIQRKVMAA